MRLKDASGQAERRAIRKIWAGWQSGGEAWQCIGKSDWQSSSMDQA